MFQKIWGGTHAGRARDFQDARQRATAPGDIAFLDLHRAGVVGLRLIRLHGAFHE